jgi:hypothetical protein
VRASFEALRRYTDIVAASVEGTLDNFAAVTGMAALPQREGPSRVLTGRSRLRREIGSSSRNSGEGRSGREQERQGGE